MIPPRDTHALVEIGVEDSAAYPSTVLQGLARQHGPTGFKIGGVSGSGLARPAHDYRWGASRVGLRPETRPIPRWAV